MEKIFQLVNIYNELQNINDGYNGSWVFVNIILIGTTMC